MISTPHFSHEEINFDLLRKRAYNLRWATLPADVVALTAADPDFPVASEIREAVIDYARGGVFSYGPFEGLPEFREAAAKVVTERKGFSCTASQVLALDSAASAMFCVARFALQPGDEAIIFDPVDFLFKASVEAAGGKAVYVPIDPDSGEIDWDTLQNKINSRTRMIGICNPHNPVGRVLSRSELIRLGEIILRHQLWVMNDEIWSDVVYHPHQHINIASIHPEVAQRTFSIYGLSKTFGLAGLRVGYVVSPSEVIHEKLVQVSQVRTTAVGVSTLSQIAAAAAYEKCWYWADAFVQHLQRNRDYALSRLLKIPGVKCREPEGTYVLFPDIRSFQRNSSELAHELLEKARVAIVPGAPQWFGPGAEGHIRICFSTSRKVLEQGLDRIERYLKISTE
jgi:aspartate/methionine/tyrosine aminotransferase